ncbi:hypothetical protein MM181_003520 [Vibrio cholerae]|nr:hypothetical protein [Vibrio cholerae]
MYLSEEQVKAIASELMPKLKAESITAMVDVVCNGLSVLGAAQRNGVTHQSLAKNVTKLKELQAKIETLNKNNLMEMIWTSAAVRKVYFKALNQGYWEDFPDEGLEGVLSFAEKVGVESVSELKAFIDEKSAVMDEFLKKLWLVHKRATQRQWRISFCFVVQLMLIHGNTDLITVEFLCQKGWDKDIAEMVLKVAAEVESTQA